MKKIFAFISPVFFLFSCQTETGKPKTDSASADFYSIVSDTSAAYDSVFAKKLGADEYSMKKYVLAYLKRGPNRNQDSAEAAKLQQAHLENIGRLARLGKLVLAGPFLDTGNVRGIYIFNTESVEEARQLTATDPAIKAGRLEMELHPWYGAASLQLVTPLYKRSEKKNVASGK